MRKWREILISCIVVLGVPGCEQKPAKAPRKAVALQLAQEIVEGAPIVRAYVLYDDGDVIQTRPRIDWMRP